MIYISLIVRAAEAESEINYDSEGQLLMMKLFVVQLIRDWRNSYTFEDWMHPATQSQLTALMDSIEYTERVRRKDMEPTKMMQRTNFTIEEMRVM